MILSLTDETKTRSVCVWTAKTNLIRVLGRPTQRRRLSSKHDVDWDICNYFSETKRFSFSPSIPAVWTEPIIQRDSWSLRNKSRAPRYAREFRSGAGRSLAGQKRCSFTSGRPICRNPFPGRGETTRKITATKRYYLCGQCCPRGTAVLPSLLHGQSGHFMRLKNDHGNCFLSSVYAAVTQLSVRDWDGYKKDHV